MKRCLAACALSLTMALGLVPSLSVAEEGDDLVAVEASEPSLAPAEEGDDLVDVEADEPALEATEEGDDLAAVEADEPSVTPAEEGGDVAQIEAAEPSMASAEEADDLTTTVSTQPPLAIKGASNATPVVTVTRATTGKIVLKVGKQYKLGAKTTVGKLSYKSSNKKVATVSTKGLVKAKKAGKATITITAKNGTKTVKKKVSVTVLSSKKYTAVKKVKIKSAPASLRVGMTGKLTISFSPTKPSNKNVIYKSSNPKVLSVSAKGKVKALKAGKAKITVTSCANSKAKASVTIEVDKRTLLERSKWANRMTLPTNKQMNTFQATDRSPYIVCWPQFEQTTGYTQYAVDFKADSQPRGTYVNIGNWWMDTTSLQKKYKSVTTDDGDQPGAAYAGFQVLEDGRKVAIMSVWKLFLTDKNGNKSTLDAKRTYPTKPAIASDFDGEGTGVKTLVDYDWKVGKTYRALIQCGKTKAGNTTLVFKVCDLESGKWTKLISYDLGYSDAYITKMGCFLENYSPNLAAEIRTAEWSNFRVKDRESGSWVAAKSAQMERQFKEWPGSYNFGSSDSCFWAITSGVPNLGTPPENGKLFEVTTAEEGSPIQ